MNKRGQIYLLAALIIVGVLMGLTQIHTKAKITEEDARVYDLSNEINYEASKVIDNGVLQGLDNQDIYLKIRNLTDFYADTNPGNSILAVYGNQSELKLLLYNNTGTGSITLGDSHLSGWTTELSSPRRFENSVEPEQNNINVSFGDEVTYFFDLKPGQIFFVILKKVKQDDIFVAVEELPAEEEGDDNGDESGLGEEGSGTE